MFYGLLERKARLSQVKVKMIKVDTENPGYEVDGTIDKMGVHCTIAEALFTG